MTTTFYVDALNDPQAAKPVNAADAMQQAGLNWKVSCVSVQTTDAIKIPGVKAVRRDDTREVLGMVSDDFEPLQNEEQFGFFDAFVEAGEASFSTAGCLENGKRTWALAKLHREPSRIMGDDIVEKYVLLSNRHDGHGAVRVGFTPIRVVCRNTLALAHSAEASKLIRVTHHVGVAENVFALRETMNLVDAEFEATADQFRALAARKINGADLRKYVGSVFGINPTEMKKDGSAPKSRVLRRIEELFETGRGAEMSRGTLWGAYNAVTEYLTHERSEDAESRTASLWFGQSAAQNERALQHAYVLATA